MMRYLVQRITGMLVVVLLVLTIAFIIVRVAPGDPAALMLGPEATPQEARDLRAQLGLDRPILVQYGAFLADAARGDNDLRVYVAEDFDCGEAEESDAEDLSAMITAVCDTL